MGVLTDGAHSVIYDSIAKANRYLSGITFAEMSDREAVKELRYMAEDLLNTLENIEIYDEASE
jgi:hypothetical protein